MFLCIFFFNETATTELYTYCPTLSLHAALPISILIPAAVSLRLVGAVVGGGGGGPAQVDLGSLSSSEETRSDRFEALILSTAPYAVRFDSANRGHLLHEPQRATVPYRLYFDGALVDLAGDNEFFYPTRTTTEIGRASCRESGCQSEVIIVVGEN